MALSLGSPPPDVIWHRVSVEPGLSSPTASSKGSHPAIWWCGFRLHRVLRQEKAVGNVPKKVPKTLMGKVCWKAG